MSETNQQTKKGRGRPKGNGGAKKAITIVVSMEVYSWLETIDYDFPGRVVKGLVFAAYEAAKEKTK